jgi:hypothetical protein
MGFAYNLATLYFLVDKHEDNIKDLLEVTKAYIITYTKWQIT